MRTGSSLLGEARSTIAEPTGNPPWRASSSLANPVHTLIRVELALLVKLKLN